MPVSPQEFSLWARRTGNQYPQSPEEKARLGPEVHNYVQNMHKQGALGENQVQEPEQQSNFGSNLAKGALIAGGIAAGVAAARNPGVREAVKTAASKADAFIYELTKPRTVDVDVSDAVRDVTPPTSGQTYSQEIVPTQKRVEGWSPAGLIQAEDPPYVHPSRVSGMPGGDFRGSGALRSFEERNPPSAELIAGRKANEAGLFNRLQERLAEIRSQGHSERLPSEIFPVPTPQGEYVTNAQVTDKVEALMDRLGKPDPRFGFVQYGRPELVESIEASGQNPINTALTSSKDNLTPKVTGTFNPNTLTGQQDIQMAADQEVDLIQKVNALTNNLEAQNQPTGLVSATRQEAAISDLDRAAYGLVAAGAESGERISLERAQQLLTNPDEPLSVGEQRAFQGGDLVALPGQGFGPEEQRPTGRMAEMRTGASGRETSVSDTDRYNLENVAGLTKQTRKGAGTSAMRGEEDRPNIAGVLPTGGGRNTRGMSAVGSNILDAAIGEQAAREELSDLTSNVVRRELEARNQPEQNYSAFTDYSTGQTPEGQARDAATAASAQSTNRYRQMNSLFAPVTEGGLLQLRTANRGNIILSKEDLQTSLGPIAEDVWNRAANHFAQERGIELPDPSSPDYFNAANNAIYGNPQTIAANSQLVGRAFNQGLQQAGIQLTEGGQDPSTAHTLFSITRKGGTGELSLREFSLASRRARSRGLLDRNPDAIIPQGLTSPQELVDTGSAQLSPPRTQSSSRGRKISFNVPTSRQQAPATSSGQLSAEESEKIRAQQERLARIRARTEGTQRRLDSYGFPV